MSHAPMPGADRLAEPMRSRWSPSVFDADHEVTPEQVELLLTAARWAPSWGNTQAWRFVVAPRGGAAHAAVVPHLRRGNAGWVPRASLLLLAGVDGDDLKPGDHTHDAAYDVGQAVAHLTLQAQAMGLVTHQYGGFDRDATAAALGVPDRVRLVAGVAVGVRGDAAEVPERDREREHRERRRRPAAEVAFVEGWRPWAG